MKQIEVVAAIIRKGDKIFATQRGYGDFKDWWEFPGGKMEAGETPEEALKREIREELSTEISVDEFLCTVEYDYPKLANGRACSRLKDSKSTLVSSRSTAAFHLTMHCYLCSLLTEALHLNEHEAARWLSMNNLDSVDWLPADLIVVKELQNYNLEHGELFSYIVAEAPSRDLDVLLAELHHAKGAYFVSLLKEIASHGEFRLVENENNIFFTGGESSEDFQNLLNAARKAVEQGYKVFILPNPKGIRTADFIFERKGVYKMFDLKTISGKSSVENRLKESIEQTNRVLLHLTVDYNPSSLARSIKRYFEYNTNACEVLVFKGKKQLSITRRTLDDKHFFQTFIRRYSK